MIMDINNTSKKLLSLICGFSIIILQMDLPTDKNNTSLCPIMGQTKPENFCLSALKSNTCTQKPFHTQENH
jgi:hypothetical protein